MVSIPNEDFLKQVFQLKSLGYKASTTALSKRLNISNAAITDMSRKLHHQGYVNYMRYREVELTAEGEKIAISVIRRHRLWELFLNRVLKIPWDKVHAEAERLEHQTSDYLIGKIDDFLNFPAVDPHGDPIPDKNGHLVQNEYVKLSDVMAPAHAALKRVALHDPATLELLDRSSVAIDDELYVLKNEEDAHEVLIEKDGKRMIIPENIARHLFMELIVK